MTAAATLGAVRMHERIGANFHFAWLVRPARLIAVKRFHPLAHVGAARRHVQHPNVVATLGFVRREREVLAAMEYVPGASLAEIVSEARGGLDARVASAIAVDTLRGLDARGGDRAAHDLSFADVLVGEDGRARVLGLTVRGPASPAAIVAKLPYASPEELVRRDADRRREVYTASVMLWETLTGRPLFRASTIQGTLQKILAGDVPPPSRFASGVAPDLDAIVLRGLARDPAARFASASGMADELERTPRATPHEVTRALATLDLECIRRRRVLADSIRAREGSSLHIECKAGGSKG